MKCLELMAGTQPGTQNASFDSCAKNCRKISCKTFYIKTYFTLFGELFYNILSMIAQQFDRVLPLILLKNIT